MLNIKTFKRLLRKRKKQMPHCNRSSCIYLSGMNKDTVFCEYCFYRNDKDD